MTGARRSLIAAAALFLLMVGMVGFAWHLRHRPGGKASPAPGGTVADSTPAKTDGSADQAPTTVHAHNLMLHKGPTFRIYVIWIRGEMKRTRQGVDPSFDAPESFVLNIDNGIIRANIGDVSSFLSDNMPGNSPLTNVSIVPDGEDLKLRGTVHKVVPLPIELDGTVSPLPDGRIRYHLKKLSVLKLPMKGLLGSFHVELADLVGTRQITGVQVVDNDILFDTRTLLPPPHIRGNITSIRVRPPDLEVIYGNAAMDEHEMAQWKNFLRLEHGTIDFGKITMHDVDLTMIDAAPDNWFDLDLVNYQAQMVNGYTRMTAQAGMEIYMPDVDEKSAKKPAKAITLEWLKNRKAALPPDVKLPKR